jgi:hypothetical protein
MFSLKIGIFILKVWGIQEESFVSDLQQCLPTDIPTDHTEFLLQTDISGFILRISSGALSTVLYKNEHLCC